MVRLFSITLGLFLVAVHLVFGDLLGVVSVLTGAVLSALPASRYFFLEFFVRSTFQTVLFLIPALFLLTCGIAPCSRAAGIDRAVAACARHSLAIAAFMAASAALIAFLLATYVIEYHPITSGDEYCYTFQAKLLQSGRFHAPPPPVIDSFRNRAFVLGERWYGIGFGGHPLFLVFGLWLGAIYLTPALLAGLSVFLTYILIRILLDRGIAALAAIMVALSPLFLFYHATLLPETSSLTLGLAWLVLVAAGVEKKRPWLFLPAAIVLAIAVMTRPQSAMILGVCVGAWLLLRPGISAETKIRALTILGIGGLTGVVGLLGYAHLVSGEPFGAHLSPGYHHDELGGIRGLGLHGPRDVVGAVANLGIAVVKLNSALLGWPLSWIVVGLWLFHRGKSGWEYALAAAAAGFIAFYFFYRASLEQYYVEAGHLLIILGAVGLVRAYRSARAAPGGWRPLGGLMALVLCSYVLGVLSVWPSRLDYFRQRTDPERMVWKAIDGAGVHRAVVCLDSLPGACEACVGHNSPDLDDDVILARVRNAAGIAEISKHFPDRALFRMICIPAGERLRLLPCDSDGSRSTRSIPSPALISGDSPLSEPPAFPTAPPATPAADGSAPSSRCAV